MSKNKRHCHEMFVSSQKGQSSHENVITNAQDKTKKCQNNRNCQSNGVTENRLIQLSFW